MCKDNLTLSSKFKLKTPKSIKIIIISALALTASFLLIILIFNSSFKYKKAIKLYNSNNYKSAIELFTKLDDYKDSKALSEKCDFHITINQYQEQQEYYEAVNYIKNNKKIIGNDSDYKKILDYNKYLLAKEYSDNHEYVNAQEYLEDNQYSDAVELLKNIEPCYNSERAVDSIIEKYDWMENWLDEKLNSVNSFREQMLLINSGVEWDSFYINRCITIRRIEKDLQSKSIEDCKYDITDLLGFVPKSKTECNKILKELKKTFIVNNSFADNNGFFLYDVMNFITDDKDYVSVTRDEKAGTITIKNVDKYLKRKNVSEKTFAYMLSIPIMYSMNIQKDEDCLILSFEYSDYSYLGYSFCMKSDSDDENKDKEITAFVEDAFDKMTLKVGDDGYDHWKLNLTNINKYNLDYLCLVFVVDNDNDHSSILYQKNKFLNKKDLLKEKLNIEFKTKHVESSSIITGYCFMGDYN